jgi:hypothetical protein
MVPVSAAPMRTAKPPVGVPDWLVDEPRKTLEASSASVRRQSTSRV